MAKQTLRLNHIDGLRGVGAMIVLFHHLMLSYYPWLGDGSHHYYHGLPLAPISLIWAGNLCVCIFFVLSGYVLALTTVNSQSYFPTLVIKRLIRLVPPVLAAMLLAYGLWRLGLMHNQQAAEITGSVGWLGLFYHDTPHILGLLREAFIMPFVPVDSHYDPVLWTMHVEYVGSFGALLLYKLLHNHTARVAALLVLFALTYETYYCDFVAGALLAEASIADRPFKYRTWIVCVLLVLSAVYGLYTWSEGGHSPYWFIDMMVGPFIGNSDQAHQLAAIFLVTAILISPTAEKLLSGKRLVAFGNISFSVYLVHLPLLCAFDALLFLILQPMLGFIPAFLVAGLLFIGLTVAVATLFTRALDKPSLALSRLASQQLDPLIARLLQRKGTPA